MKTEEIPAIVEEAKEAGCQNDAEIIGFLAAEISQNRAILGGFRPHVLGEMKKLIVCIDCCSLSSMNVIGRRGAVTIELGQ